MGRDWYWGGGKNSSTSKENIVINRENPGCMSGILNLFDFHHFQFPITQPPCFKPNSILQEDPTFIKGVEEPRNSLEESEENMNMECCQES
ncbi:hypothetical protein FRX31_010103 [Thalictrum thalictroides]|uniref:Uncharacterized protein n=1 Tax=Thalictrum thalictroides TaxID=46969 RepID=A0A7J6WTE6_THATH|nr:hypothetical protein FRX31_010103 [Thalictrum thalictroides]